MRVSLGRRWLAFTLVLPAAGLAVLLRVAPGRDEATPHERAPLPGRSRPAFGAGRATARDVTPAVAGRVEAGARARAADASAVAASRPETTALGAALRPLLGKLHAAQETDDERAIAARRAEVSALIATDPPGALAALLAELRAASDESELGVILSVLLGEGALPREELLAALSDMARSDELPVHRQAAIHALGELGSDERRVAELAELGRRDREPEVRETAAVTVGSLGDRMPGPVAQSAARELVASLAVEADPRVRTSLLYAFRDTREAPAANALLSALADGDACVRLAAADMLGDVAAAHRERAVQALAARFSQESEREVRQTIVTAIVRAGRIAAVPVLERLDGGEVQPLIDDFLAGLRSGEDNLEKLYAVRFAREKARGKPE